MKKSLLIITLILCLIGFCSCKEENPSQFIEETYELSKATLDGEDITNEYNMFKIEFKKDLTCEVLIVKSTGIEKRSSTYTFDGNFIVETYNNKTYTYAYNDKKISYEDIEMGLQVVLVIQQSEEGNNKTTGVDFNSVLFGDSIDNTKIYNYCPAIIVEKNSDGQEVMHIWYCTNLTSGVIMDYIGYRTGIKNNEGLWEFSEQQIALSPTPGTWDGRHTCDPAVIKGEFKLQGETYYYLMSYLGCVTEDYSKNETGIAVSKTPAGPWVKVDSINPIVPYTDPNIFGDGSSRNSDTQWGTGMPALLSVDKKGDVLLFFQSSARGTGIQRWDFSNLDDPHIIFDSTRNNNGILNSTGIKCNVGIPDVAFDPVKKRFYIFGVTNEKNPPNITETLVNSHCVLAYVDGVEDTNALCDLLQNGQYTWTNVGYVGPEQTTWERNHNPGIVRNEYGYVYDSDNLMVVVSTGRRDYPNQNIFTYRLHGWTYQIK